VDGFYAESNPSVGGRNTTPLLFPRKKLSAKKIIGLGRKGVKFG
jgi:hypothetical protein